MSFKIERKDPLQCLRTLKVVFVSCQKKSMCDIQNTYTHMTAIKVDNLIYRKLDLNLLALPCEAAKNFDTAVTVLFCQSFKITLLFYF